MFSISRSTKSLLPYGMLALAILFPAQGYAFNQAESQQSAANTNHHGSDDDQDEATRNAMKAFMNLSALNIPGAISKGYEAYGNYINSEKLDDLEAKTKRLRGSMGSAAGSSSIMSGVSGASADFSADSQSGVTGTASKRMTTLSNLNPDFLYKGETAVVAAEFEKRSGMKREEFLKHLSAATDARYTFDDPDLQSKLEQRFQAFKERIPNKEFREGLERAESMVPNAIRAKMLGEAMAFYKDSWKNDGTKVAVAPTAPAALDTNAATAAAADAAAKTAAATAAAANATAAAGAVGGDPAADRAPASATVADKDGVYPRQIGMYIGLKENQDALKDFVQAGNLLADQDTIFKAVSLRYRKLTPALLGKKTL